MKKLTALLLSILLVFSVCFGAFADTQYSVSVKLGEGLGLPDAVNDLCDAVKIVATKGSDFMKLGLNISDSEVTSFVISSDEDGFYVSNNILADEPMYFNYSDIVGFIVKMLKSDEAEAQESSDKAELPAFDFKKLISTALTDSKLLSFVMNMTMVADNEDGEYQLDNCNPATHVMTLHIDEKDIVDLLDSATVQYVAEYFSQTGDTDILETINSLHQGILSEEISFSIIAKLYSDQGDFVALDMAENLTAYGISLNETTFIGRLSSEDSETYYLKEDLTQNDTSVLTVTGDLTSANDENKNNYTFNYSVMQENSCILSATGTILSEKTDSTDNLNVNIILNDGNSDSGFAFTQMTESDGNYSGSCSFLSQGVQLTGVFTSVKTEISNDFQLDIYLRTGATAIIEPAASERPIATLFINAAETAELVENPLASAAPETSMQLLQMSEEEIAAWVESLSARASSTLFYALSLLPESALSLFGLN